MRKPYLNGNINRDRIMQLCLDWKEEKELCPTIQELAYELNLSITNVAYHLKELEKAGKIKRMPGKARGIQVTR